jgi:hypothetical protein
VEGAAGFLDRKKKKKKTRRRRRRMEKRIVKFYFI